MSYYLIPNNEKLNRNNVKSVASRVVNLNSLSANVTVEQIQQAMIYTVKAKLLQAELEKKKIDRMMTFYKNKEWIF